MSSKGLKSSFHKTQGMPLYKFHHPSDECGHYVSNCRKDLKYILCAQGTTNAVWCCQSQESSCYNLLYSLNYEAVGCLGCFYWNEMIFTTDAKMNWTNDCWLAHDFEDVFVAARKQSGRCSCFKRSLPWGWCHAAKFLKLSVPW